MVATVQITDVTLDHNAYVLASRAEVNSPDSDTSHGAQFLRRCQDAANEVDAEALLEAIREVEAQGEEFAEHHLDNFDTEITDGADSAGSIYTYTAWREFTDLCLWNEDVEELGEVRADHLTEDVAMRATYLVARRLIPALVVERAVALLEANPEPDEVITTGSFVFRASQENGDNVDCQSCGNTLNDDRDEIVTNADGFAFCSPKCLLDDHDAGETLHAFIQTTDALQARRGFACAQCGDTAEGLMHNNTERNVEPLLWTGE